MSKEESKRTILNLKEIIDSNEDINAEMKQTLGKNINDLRDEIELIECNNEDQHIRGYIRYHFHAMIASFYDKIKDKRYHMEKSRSLKYSIYSNDAINHASTV